MKIIHCADLHLDSQMTANLTKEQARERKREIIRTFTRMVEYAEKTGVRLIMISGDLFDTRNVSALARNTVSVRHDPYRRGSGTGCRRKTSRKDLCKPFGNPFTAESTP